MVRAVRKYDIRRPEWIWKRYNPALTGTNRLMSVAFSGHLEILISVTWNTNQFICAERRKIDFHVYVPSGLDISFLEC